MKIKNGIVAAIIGAVSLAGAAPVHASTDPGPCQLMGPNYVGGAVDCVKYILVTLIDWPPR